MDNLKKEIFKKVEEYFKAKPHTTSQKIGVAYPCFDHKEVNQALDSLLDVWISQGPKVREFEKAYAAYIDTQHGIACNSGSSANLLALTALIQAAHLRPGDEVVVPAATFTTVISPILQTGLVPVFVDVELDTYNNDPEAIRAAITKNTKLIMVVHSLGCPANMIEIMKISKEYGIPVLEDCCEAHGASINGKKVGSFGLISTFSFFVAHNMTTGEGGMVMTSDERLHDILRSIREFGRLTKYEKNQPRFYYEDENLSEYDERYVFTTLGYNLRMTDIAASLGIEQLKKLDAFNNQRVKIADFYNEVLQEYNEFLTLPKVPEGYFHSFYGYPVLINGDTPFSRQQLVNYLEKNNIETRAFMGGDLSKQPAYVGTKWKRPFEMPNTDLILNNAFFIGSHPFINQEQRNHIASTFRKFFFPLRKGIKYMSNKVGVVGIGIVGEAIKYGMEKLGHHVVVHDIRYNTQLADLVKTEICFICVPTPSKENLQCDTSIVEEVVGDLHKLNYKGIIAIKSTVPPSTTERLQAQHKNNNICFVPEFLRERCAISDFTENHDICIIGSSSLEICNFIQTLHGKYPKEFKYLTPTEAECAKYYNNIYNAALVILANNFYEVCQALNINYSAVKSAIVGRDHINDVYLDCNENFRGYAGACLPKDVGAFVYLVKELGIDAGIFEFLNEENKKYKPTVFPGMRND